MKTLCKTPHEPVTHDGFRCASPLKSINRSGVVA